MERIFHGAKDAGVTENEIGKLVVDSAVTVHRELGSGLLETVDEVCIIDDFSTGGIENIQHLKGRQGKTGGVGTEASENVKAESTKG